MRRNSLRSLAKKRDFELVFKEGSSAAAQYLVLYARPNQLPCNRLGFSVSKKIGKAVTRNRIKRLLRESVRKVFGDLFQHYDFVIVAKKKAAEAKLENFIREMERASSIISYEKCPDSVPKTL